MVQRYLAWMAEAILTVAGQPRTGHMLCLRRATTGVPSATL